MIAILVRIAAEPLRRGHSDVERLSRRREVDRVLASPFTSLDKITKEPLGLFADTNALILFKKPMAIQLYKNEIRTSGDGHVRGHPSLESCVAESLIRCESPVLDPRY